MGDPTVLFGQMGIFPAEDGGVTGSPLEGTVGYQALSADELAATLTSGMEARNLQQISDEAAQAFGDTVDLTQYYADPHISWNNGAPYAVTTEDMQGDAAFRAMLKQAMPDVAVEPLTIVVSEGDWVAAVLVISGMFTEDVDFFGTPLTATGEQITWVFGFFDRYDADGKVVEQWIEGNPMPLLGGLGLMPAFGE